MKQDSLTTKRIVSLHLEKCSVGCPNSKVCYLNKRVTKPGSPLPDNFREELLKNGYIIHEAICSSINKNNKYLLSKYKNYHITTTFPIFMQSGLNKSQCNPDKLQISVYSLEQVNKVGNNFLKMFLIKDLETQRIACSIIGSQSIKNVHFNIEQNFNTIQLLTLQNSKRNITLDTCLTSWIINGECPYLYNYIDISYDWTIRKCPFSNDGIPIPKNIINKKNSNYEDLFKLTHQPPDCAYSKRFTIKGK